MTIISTEEEFINAVAYHPSGTVVACATHSSMIQLRDACTGKPVRGLMRTKGYIEVRNGSDERSV